MIKSGATAMIQHRMMANLRRSCSCIKWWFNGVVKRDEKLGEEELTIFNIYFSHITNS